MRALHDTQEFDKAIAAAVRAVDLRDTLIIVSADHSHVFNIAGYPLRPRNEMPYPMEPCANSNYGALAGHGILDLVYDVNMANRCAAPSVDSNGSPTPRSSTGTVRATAAEHASTRRRIRSSAFQAARTFRAEPDWIRRIPNYRQEAAVPITSETHSAEEVAIYAVGPGAELVRGTVKNTFIYSVMAKALGF